MMTKNYHLFKIIIFMKTYIKTISILAKLLLKAKMILKKFKIAKMTSIHQKIGKNVILLIKKRLF